MGNSDDELPSGMVRLWDSGTKSIRLIPEEDLHPGMIQVQVQGVPGLVWVDSARLRVGPVRREGLSEDLRTRIRAIKNILDDVDPRPLDEWEVGFLRDMSPENEIAVWERISRTYARFSARREFSPVEKLDILKVALTASTCAREKVLDLVLLKELPPADAAAVLEDFENEEE